MTKTDCKTHHKGLVAFCAAGSSAVRWRVFKDVREECSAVSWCQSLFDPQRTNGGLTKGVQRKATAWRSGAQNPERLRRGPSGGLLDAQRGAGAPERHPFPRIAIPAQN